MSVTIRRAGAADAELLAQHRAAVWHEVGEWTTEELAPALPLWESWFREAVPAATYLACIAERDGAVAGSGAILVQAAIPRPEYRTQEQGRVHSVYVVPAARRAGLGRAIMETLIRYARERTLMRLTLHPSDEARGLYLALGFAPLDELGMNLAP